MFPEDSPQARTGARAVAIVRYQIDSNIWEWHEETGNDTGRDCCIELIEDGEFRNHKAECQIKGTTHIDRYLLANGDVSFPFPSRTILYGLNSMLPFIVFLVDNVSETIRFIDLDSYAISNPSIPQKAKTQMQVNLHFSKNQILRPHDQRLAEITLGKHRSNALA